jgi:RNA polymerase sigma-70 factor (ECF subfamily)
MSTATVPKVNSESLSPDFEEAYRQYSPMVYRTARAVTGNPEDAEDVLQTIFLRLIRQEDSGQLRKNPKAYLYRAAVNLSLDVLRARTRRTFTHEVEALEAPAPAPTARFDEDTHAKLQQALAELSPEAAHILVLRYVHNYSDAEISKLLGTSRGAIALRLFRLRTRLKKALYERR